MSRSCPRRSFGRPERVFNVELFNGVRQRREQPVPKVIGKGRIFGIEAVAIWQEIDEITQRVSAKDVRGSEYDERSNLSERRSLYKICDLTVFLKNGNAKDHGAHAMRYYVHFLV